MTHPDVELCYSAREWAKQIVEKLQTPSLDSDGNYLKKSTLAEAEGVIAAAIEDLFQDEDTFEVYLGGRLLSG